MVNYFVSVYQCVVAVGRPGWFVYIVLSYDFCMGLCLWVCFVFSRVTSIGWLGCSDFGLCFIRL